jgi:hypothetical protein
MVNFKAIFEKKINLLETKLVEIVYSETQTHTT